MNKNICSSKISRNLVNFGSMQLLLNQRTIFAHWCTRCVCLTRDSAWTNNRTDLGLPPSENSEKLSSYMSDSYLSHFQERNYLGVSKNVTELNCRVKAALHSPTWPFTPNTIPIHLILYYQTQSWKRRSINCVSILTWFGWKTITQEILEGEKLLKVKIFCGLTNF